MGRYYLYRHIRIDKNEVFYVGMGTKIKKYNTYITEYKRAHATSRRSQFWKNITNKTEYEVEILMESEDKNFIKQKEKEFIKLYGRRSKEEGTLVNLTAGGDGSLDVVVSKETRLKQSRRKTKEIREAAAKRLSKTCFHITTKRKFESLKTACKTIGEDYGAQKMAILHKRPTAKFMFVGEEFEPIIKKRYQARRCKFIETGEEFNSLRQACINKGLKYSQQQDALKLNLSTQLFKWISDE